MKIHVIGATGSGKTTVRRLLGAKLSIPFADLDDIFWSPQWTDRPLEVVFREVETFTDQDSWIICGNYPRVRPIIMEKADYILWLDLPFWTNLVRLSIRTFRRVFFRESCCNGNYETLFQVLFTKNSIIRWYFQSFWKYRKEYSQMKSEDSKNGGKIIRLTSDKEVTDFVELLAIKLYS